MKYDKDKKIAETNLDDADITIGGSMPGRFVPNINCKKWNDECWLNINHPDVVGVETESFVDDKAAIKVGNNTHRYYVTDDGKLEYEIEFKERPESNAVELNLDFPAGLRFCYQDTLYNEWLRDDRGMLWEEYQQRHNRPENVIGSYAVYWREANNQFKTGKFCHIYRPELIDANGKRAWADLHIDAKTKKLTITIDGEWLDQAAYPVILDPILGYNTAGLSDTSNAGYIEGHASTTDGTGGATNSYHVAIHSIDTNPGVKIGIFNADQDTGNPASKTLVEQVEFDVAVSNDESTAGGSTSLAASTKYYIGWIVEEAGTDIKYDTVAETEGFYRGGYTYADEFTSPFAANASGGTRKYSVWIVYGGAAGPSIPILQSYYRQL